MDIETRWFIEDMLDGRAEFFTETGSNEYIIGIFISEPEYIGPVAYELNCNETHAVIPEDVGYDA